VQQLIYVEKTNNGATRSSRGELRTVDKPEDFNAMVKNPEAKAHMKLIRGTTETDFHLYEVAHSF